ncbi:MAG: hypothetical protein OM95_14255 [Bdellovibrio sp. ArHS]|uniref:penicillin-insensitive murein endopeptidase n=1 Tax=Bdellovibrio sp. ArHS TaxID=1569284 RepID=UPI000582EAA1|nr:penicillin-insensitive murein endopeptidase [Bdellovibrio sp. ArHS]KHD87452.1 MAG: hypothetical protein OM95_14255 [Bdellovibrio sp. ArHS]
MKNRFLTLIFSFPLVLSACAPDQRDQGSTPVTTYEPPRPTVTEQDGYRIARGATRLIDMKVVFDATTKAMALKGKIEYLPMRATSLQTIEVDLSGILDSDGFIQLRNHRKDLSLPQGLQLAAKATCLSEEGSCQSSFIDVYLYADGVVYHHQIESQQEQPPQTGPEVTPEEELESEGGADDVEGDPGQYVGSIKEDIETLLEVKPEPKKEEPKAPAQSSETPKKEDPKKEEPKKEEPKKEEPKKDDPKKDDGKMEDSKVPIPTPRPKDEPKKEDPKKDEPQRQEPKADSRPEIKKASQAIGPVNQGRLENAMNMLRFQENHSPAGFSIMRPARLTHFATNELGYIIAQMGLFTKQEMPGYVLSVGDLSREKGGKLGSHKSHQNGLDADVALFFNNKSFQGFFASAVTVDKPHANWMAEEQWKLFKHVVKTQLIDRIFIHKVLKKSLCNIAIKNGELQKGKNEGLAYETLRRLVADTDHHNHFHLRVKCSSAQVRCRQMAEPASGSGCF